MKQASPTAGQWRPVLRQTRRSPEYLRRLRAYLLRGKIDCEICGTISPGQHGERCVFGLWERERAEEKARLAVWRDDRGGKGFSRFGLLSRLSETPTISTIITCAEDVTTVEMTSAYDTYVLVIAHTDTFRGNRSGKGFTPKAYRIYRSVFHPSQWAGNFNTFQTWQEALEKGTAALREMVERENQEWAAFHGEQDRLKAEFPNV
jgi:hypothetical protein